MVWAEDCGGGPSSVGGVGVGVGCDLGECFECGGFGLLVEEVELEVGELSCGFELLLAFRSGEDFDEVGDGDVEVVCEIGEAEGA